MINEDILFDTSLFCYNHLNEKISLKHKKAVANGKETLVVIKEEHYDKIHNLAGHMALEISTSLGINNLYYEIDGERLNYISYNPQYGGEILSDIQMSRCLGMKLIPIDTYLEVELQLHIDEEDIFDKAISPEGIANRNRVMVNHLKNHAKSGVVIIGGDHGIGITTPLEGHDISDIYEIIEINLCEGFGYIETISDENILSAMKYISEQDIIMPLIIKMMREVFSNDYSLHDDETENKEKLHDLNFVSDFLELRATTIEHKQTQVPSKKNIIPSMLLGKHAPYLKQDTILEMMPEIMNRNNDKLFSMLQKQSYFKVDHVIWSPEFFYNTLLFYPEKSSTIQLILEHGINFDDYTYRRCNKPTSIKTNIHDNSLDVELWYINGPAMLSTIDNEECPLGFMLSKQRNNKNNDTFNVIEYFQTHHCMSIPAPFYTNKLISEIACFPNEKISTDVTLENKEDNQRENIFLSTTSAV